MAFQSCDLGPGNKDQVELLLFDDLAGFLGTPQCVVVGYGEAGELASNCSLEDGLYLITTVRTIGMYM
jgi:hypothetical protein